eukprot:417874_1
MADFNDYVYDIPKIRNFVTKKVIVIERQYTCKVLFAVERSSHIWGTSHTKSDNDVQCLMFYPPRAYYSVINSCAENARLHQNKRRNTINRNKQQQINQYKSNTFVRDLKIQYGHRFTQHTEVKDEQDTELDVEISFHEISKWMRLICESNLNLYEIICSPIVYYHLYDLNHMQMLRNIICNLYDYVRLSENYYHVAFKNYRKLHNRNTNRVNRDPKMKVKALFVIWRCILMAEWLMQHKCVHDMPFYVPDLIKKSRLLNDSYDTDKHMLLNKLKNGINKGIYRVDDTFDILCDKADGVLDTLLNRIECAKRDQKHDIDGIALGKEIKQNENALENIVVDMIQSYHTFGKIQTSEIKYDYRIPYALEDELLSRMDVLISATHDAIDALELHQ